MQKYTNMHIFINLSLIFKKVSFSGVHLTLIFVKCEEFLYTSDNQFGFKSGHSTEVCIYTLQEYIEFYKRRNTTVFVTFLDASKAFD